MTQFNILLKRFFPHPKNFYSCFWRSMSSSELDVILEQKGNVGVITLNRPKSLNALNISMIRKIYPQLKKWEVDPQVKLVIIKGSGDKAFCAGGDVRAVIEAGKKGDSLKADFFKEEYKLNHLIGTLQIPYVALIHGITMGGGVGLSVHGSYRVATEKTVVAMPEAAIGFFPDVGGSYFLPKLPGKLGIFLALTGFRVSGRDVLKSGIATHFVSSNLLPDLETALMNIPSPTLADVDKVLDKFQDQCESEFTKEFELKYVKGKINTAFAAKSLPEIFQHLEKEGSEWSRQQLSLLKKLSPTSLCVTLRLLEEGSRLGNLGDCLKLEFQLTQHFLAHKDFYEGVRAVLIDKDNQPKWDPPSIDKVTEDLVASFFKPIDDKLQLD